MQSSKNNTSPVELQNNNRIRNKTTSISVKEEWKKANKRNTYKNSLVKKTKGNYENYFKNFKETDYNTGTIDKEIKYQYYKHKNKITELDFK